MNNVNLLRKTLKPHLKWHGARLSFLALFLIALFRVKTVNLSELSTGFMGKAKAESNYKRLQRFLREFDLDYYVLAKLVIEMMEIPEPWTLSVDRTNWQFGRKVFNILTLGVVHQGVAFPLLWWMLDKKGNSNTIERVELLEEFVELFSNRKIACICADREFLGQKWLQYLFSQPMMPFRIRIREIELLGSGKQALPVRTVFSHLQIGQIELLPRTRSLCLSRLFALLTIALCWAYRTGQWLSQHHPIKIKKHGRKAKSVFRGGFDYLRRIFLNLEQYEIEFRYTLQFLSCT